VPRWQRGQARATPPKRKELGRCDGIGEGDDRRDEPICPEGTEPVSRQRRLLLQIERHLVLEDPVLAEAFHLWNERCAGVEAARPSERAGRILLLGAAALILAVWVAW
jgi:hypothetical protein